LITLGQLSNTIGTKRRPDLDGEIDFDKIELSPYDIRTERNVPFMAKSLARDGQLHPLTVTFNGGKIITVNGRTRYYGFKTLKEKGKWVPNLVNSKVKIEAYENLDRLEQNYLNATINSHQKTLNPDEKLAFVEQHKDDLDENSLREALGLEKIKQVRSYKDVAEMLEEQPELRPYLKTTKDGRGRGEVEIETASIISSLDDKVGRLALAKQAKHLKNRNITDRARRKELTNKAKKYKELRKSKDKIGLNDKQIAAAVMERSNDSLFSLFSASKGSSGKYAAFYDWLAISKVDVAIIFNPTTPYLDGSPTFESEAAMAIRLSQIQGFEVILIEQDTPIAKIWENYCKSYKNVKIYNKSAEEFMVENLTFSKEKTLFYFNFKGDRAAREFMRPALTMGTLRKRRPNSTIGHILVEEWNIPTSKKSNYLEILSWFGVDFVSLIKTIEDFSSQLASVCGISYSIKWHKLLQDGNKRRTALVVFE